MPSDKKVAFITGGNRGIGLQTARDLANLGIHVVIGSRDAAKGEAAVKSLRSEGATADSVQCEVTNLKDHQAVYDYLNKKFGKLDILINNAAVMIDRPPEGTGGEVKASKTSQETLRKTFDANFFAPIALTQALLPLISKSPAGRIVNLTSVLGSLTLQADPKSPIYNAKTLAYDASKAAINMFTIELAHELKDTPIKVNSAHPGWVKTDMGGANAPMEITDGSKTSVQLATLPADGPTGGYFHMGERLPW
jgi:NAD(P)-dependent dehydrogenase (short-subunit alcohol dehydrogenase family)